MCDEYIISEIESRVKHNGNFGDISHKIHRKKITNEYSHYKLFKLLPAFTLACVMIIGASMIINDTDIPSGVHTSQSNISANLSDEHNWEIIYEEKENHTSLVPKWEERSIIQKYSDFKYNNYSYCVWSTILSEPISSNYLDLKLDTIDISGYDVYEDKTHLTTADIYSIQDIDASCAVGVKFEGQNKIYAYINNFYRFSSIDELIEKLNLYEYSNFEHIYYQYTDEEKEHLIRFSPVEEEFIWNNLLDYSENENIFIKGDISKCNSFISINVSIEALGIRGDSSWVGLDSEGFIEIRILSSNTSRSIFKIDKKKINDFMEYLIRNVKGYEIIYIEN